MAAPLRRVQWTKQPKQSRGRGLSFARALRRPKQKQGTATRSSAPVFASGHRPAPQKAAKRKRMQPSAPSTCYNPYNSYKMNTPSGAIQASRGGIKTVEIVAFVGISGGGRLSTPQIGRAHV